MDDLQETEQQITQQQIAAAKFRHLGGNIQMGRRCLVHDLQEFAGKPFSIYARYSPEVMDLQSPKKP